MQGTAAFRHSNTAIVAVSAVEAPIVVTSAQFDERLASTYERLDIRPGLLEGLAGIRERRWWPTETRFADAAVMAGEAVLEEAGIDRGRIGLLIGTSVCRDHLEPSSSVEVHHRLGMPTSCMNFDLANACLGFVNGMHLASTMIDSGQIEYAIVVDSEGSRHTQEVTLDRLAADDATAEDMFAQFATLTLGSGAAAMVLGPADRHPEGHRMVASASRAATQHYDLCVGDLDRMRTDTKALLDAGLELAETAWRPMTSEVWADMDRYIIHQISSVHTSLTCQRLGIDPKKVPLTFPFLGNVGPASVPITLASESASLNAGDRVLCLGIGSGLNTAATELIW